MDTALSTSQVCQKEQDTFRTISLAALLTGTLHIIAANIHFYFDTGRDGALKSSGIEEPLSFSGYLAQGGMCKYISGAVFGNEAGAGGTLMIVWGVVFHYIIAFLFTAFLFIVYTKTIKRLKKKSVVVLVYGLFTWAIMNFLVIPLSKINKFPSDPLNSITALLILALVMGLPVSLIAHRFYSRKGMI